MGGLFDSNTCEPWLSVMNEWNHRAVKCLFVAATLGANFSIHKEKAKRYDPQGPVASVYKKTDARADITSGQRDTFWAKSEQEEEQRRAREVEEKRLKRQAEDRERKEKDMQAAAARERAADERFKKIQQQK